MSGLNAGIMWVVVSTVSLLIAGCVQSLPSEPIEAPRQSAVPINTVVDPKAGYGEPSLGVAPDGALYTFGLDYGDPLQPFVVYRSDDDGQTWQRVGAPSPFQERGDPYIVVDVDGVVWWVELSNACATSTVSKDKGVTWSVPNRVACALPKGDRPWIIPTRDGEAIIYYKQNGYYMPDAPLNGAPGTFYMVASRTTTYGDVWIQTGPIESPDHHRLAGKSTGWPSGGFWNRAQDTIFLTFTWLYGDPLSPASSSAPGFATTSDRQAWSTTEMESPSTGELASSLITGAADEAGNLYLVWLEHETNPTGEETRVSMVASRDNGRTWSPTIRVDEGPESEVLPTVTAGAEGEVAIAYYAGNRSGHPSATPDETAWTVRLSWTNNIFDHAPNFHHANLSNGPVKQGRICPYGNACPPQDRTFLDYFQIQRLPDGRVAGVWNSVNEIPGTLVIVYGATTTPILHPLD